MGARNSSGFTIIETMLFLAVTGLLIMGALIGTGTALANQRYNDAVETFKGQVQAQYAELGSIKNSRPNTWSCGSDAKPVVGSEFRGQSDCTIVGRYMVINQSDISIFTVLAHKRAIAPDRANDIATLKLNYNFNVDGLSEDRTMEWGTEIARPTTEAAATTPASLGILFIRSPESGTIYTFTSNTVPAGVDAITTATITDMMSEASNVANQGMGERTVCVKSGGLIQGGDRSIYLSPRAASASAVEVRNNNMGTARC